MEQIQQLKKLTIENKPNGYVLGVTDEVGKEKKYIYHNALDLACGIIVRVHYGMIDEIYLDQMKKIVFEHEEMQKMFATAQMKHVAREKELRAERDRYKEERDAVKKEYSKYKKKHEKK